MDYREVLPRNTVLDGKYRIERVLGAGGFGITYEAMDVGLGMSVAIKEYYPSELALRDQSRSVRPRSDKHQQLFDHLRSSFLREAQTLAQFDDPCIVRVISVFPANGTAYMVMRYEVGLSMKAWLAQLGRLPTQNEIDRILVHLLRAMELMHSRDFLHRDIATDNIILRPDGSPVLLDFGSSRRVIAETTGTLTGIVKQGFSPPEQYSADSKSQGPWTDIYAMAATLYRCTTGKMPPEGTARMLQDDLELAVHAATGGYREDFLDAIDWALEVQPRQRPQNISEWREALFAGIGAGFDAFATPSQPIVSSPVAGDGNPDKPVLASPALHAGSSPSSRPSGRDRRSGNVQSAPSSRPGNPRRSAPAAPSGPAKRPEVAAAATATPRATGEHAHGFVGAAVPDSRTANGVGLPAHRSFLKRPAAVAAVSVVGLAAGAMMLFGFPQDPSRRATGQVAGSQSNAALPLLAPPPQRTPDATAPQQTASVDEERLRAEAERVRREAGEAAERQRLEAERQQQAAEAQRRQQAEAERLRLAAEAERQRKAAESERVRQLAEAERQRLAAEAERQKQATEAERQRQAAEVERQARRKLVLSVEQHADFVHELQVVLKEQNCYDGDPTGVASDVEPGIEKLRQNVADTPRLAMSSLTVADAEDFLAWIETRRRPLCTGPSSEERERENRRVQEEKTRQQDAERARRDRERQQAAEEKRQQERDAAAAAKRQQAADEKRQQERDAAAAAKRQQATDEKRQQERDAAAAAKRQQAADDRRQQEREAAASRRASNNGGGGGGGVSARISGGGGGGGGGVSIRVPSF